MSKARAHVSPMDPPVLPMNISQTDGSLARSRFPCLAISLIIASGVAVVSESTPAGNIHFVIATGKESSRMALPTRAGLKIL